MERYVSNNVIPNVQTIKRFFKCVIFKVDFENGIRSK